MGGETDAYSDPKDGLKRKVDQSIELAKQKAQELAARLNNDAETKRARFDTQSTSPVRPATAFSQPSFYDNSLKHQFQPSSYSSYGSTPTSKKISIPNDKVGVIIGRGGDTIKSLQLQSGARIQITKDAEAYPGMATRDVDLVGTTDQVSRAEELIHSVIAEADAGGSASVAAHGVRSGSTGGDQVVMKVPDNRVALLIGKGGETIKTIQNRSGARLQIVPLRPPPNEILTERSVFINGTQEQIDSAQEMVNEIAREGRLRVPPGPSGYMQPAYTSPASWAPPAQAPNQQYQTGYEYSAPGAYPHAASYYGGYGANPQAGWDQSNPPSVPPPQQSTGYNFYGQADQTGSAPPAYNYGYGQPQAPVPSQSGNQGYPPQPASYGHSYPGQPLTVNQPNTSSTTPGYGQPPTYESAAAQPTKTPPPNPIAYSQGTATQASYATPPAPLNSQPSYGTPQSYIALQTSQPAYGTSYTVASQPAYGTSQATYGAQAQQGFSANPAVYGAQQGYSVPPTSQPGYGLLQQGYTVPPTYDQAGYGGKPSSLPPPATAQPPYGQSAYLGQPVPASSAYPPPPPPAYGQSQSKTPSQPQQPPGHLSKPNGDESASQGHSSSPAVQTNPHSSSRVA
ncbi:hypothetical protein QQ045_007091 [Rhodiola kirilowii]